MPHVRPTRLIGELTFLQIPDLVRKNSALCLPIGSIEQHGPHLPLNTDVVIAEAFTKLLVSRWGESLDLWQLPTISISLAREHEWAPGTLSLSLQGITALLHDVGRGIARALPARNLVVVNGHGGNKGVLEAVTQDLRADFGFNVCTLSPTGLTGSDATTEIPDIHAGKTETSMMLAVAAHLVRPDLMAQLKNPPAADAVAKTVLQAGVTVPWTSDNERIADMGVIGDPRGASAELGRQLMDHAVETAGSILRNFLNDQRSPRSAG
jgi:creatinine amidohydrolase/Fe(II)-dependent formamide hydrolase-like protein